MVEPVEIAQIVAAFFVGASVLSLVVAVAQRIAGPYSRRGRLAGAADQADSQRAIAALQDDVDMLRGELDTMRSKVAEIDDVQNRLDFAERMLAQAKERGVLPGGKLT